MRKKESEPPAGGRDLFAAGEAVFTVGEFLDYVNTAIGQREAVVRGEITGFKVHPTGIYFSLKDGQDQAVMDCYLSSWVYRSLGIALEDGLEIKATGVPQIWKAKGRFSFRVANVELFGEGSLKKAYDLLKKKLESEGLFERKRELPDFIGRVGIVTSRTGAVIDDFRKNIAKLGMQLFLYDVRVEGATAAPSVIQAVRWFNARLPDLDVLVIMRGGGSLEDLQAFNNENVVREVFASRIPTICAIGHDRDVPLVQMVGDEQASTPTAAAVKISASWQPLHDAIPVSHTRIVSSFEKMIAQTKHEAFSGLQYLMTRIAEAVQKYKHLSRSLFVHFERMMGAAVEKVSSAEKYLRAASPERALRLGYSIAKTPEGKIIRSIADISAGEDISIRVADGSIESTVRKINEN